MSRPATFAAGGAGSDKLPAPLLAMLRTVSPAAGAELYRALALTVYPPPQQGAVWRRDIGPLADMVRPLLPPLSEIAGPADGPRALRRVDFREAVMNINLSANRYDRERPLGSRPSRWLIARYRHWSIALEVAAGLLPDGRYIGRRAPGPNLIRGKARKPRFERDEHPAAIRQCALALGRVPTSNQYILWSRIQRAIARAAGEHVEAACRLPDWKSFRTHYGGWPQALAATHLDPGEIAEARKMLLASLPADYADLHPDNDGPRVVLAALDPVDAEDLGLTPSQVRRLAKNGFGTLPISTAAELAHRLGGSLSWLVELDDQPGEPCDPRLRFSPASVRALRAACGLPEDVLRHAAGLTIKSDWRKLMSAGSDPELRVVRDLARALSTRVEALLKPL